jgi:hypothetical protein
VTITVASQGRPYNQATEAELLRKVVDRLPDDVD